MQVTVKLAYVYTLTTYNKQRHTYRQLILILYRVLFLFSLNMTVPADAALYIEQYIRTFWKSDYISYALHYLEFLGQGNDKESMFLCSPMT